MNHLLALLATAFVVCIIAFWMLRLRDALLTLKALPLPDQTQPVGLPEKPPLVSALIPANNEEAHITNCLGSLFAQDYPHLEVILVDDRSTDKTATLARALNSKGRPFQILPVTDLPAGWTGKCHALTHGFHRASGDWLVFLDADSRLAPDAVSRCVSIALRAGVNLVTLTPKPELASFWEKALQPVFMAVFAMMFPFWKINDPASPVASANGMFILISREAYVAVGGHESVRRLAVEDVGLAKRVKAAGLGVLAVNGTHLMTTRMYANFREILAGWTRILGASTDYRIGRVLSLIATHLCISAPMTAAAAYGYVKFSAPLGPAFQFVPVTGLVAIITATLILYFRQIGLPAYYALFTPVGNLVLIQVLFCALKMMLCREPLVWRGTVYKDLGRRPGDLEPDAEPSRPGGPERLGISRFSPHR